MLCEEKNFINFLLLNCLDLYHAQCFPQCLLCICFPSSLRKQFILGNFFSSKSRKLYQQNTSVVLVSVELTQLTCQLLRRFHQILTLGHESLAFWLFWRKARGFEHQLSWASSVSWLVSSALAAWTCLVCLKAGPTLVAMALLIGQIKELTQYWVSSTNQSKGDLSFGQAFKPPRQAQANRLGKLSQLNQKYK